MDSGVLRLIDGHGSSGMEESAFETFEGDIVPEELMEELLVPEEPSSQTSQPPPSEGAPTLQKSKEGDARPAVAVRRGGGGMRFNERELVSLSRQPSERAAQLGMRGPKKGDGLGPLGALLLEQCRVEREDSQAFSIAFLDESERKYLFECDSQEQCQDWMDSVIRASYESMRKSLIFYRTEIQRITGKVRYICSVQC
ncbi:PKHJ1 protein, partial [Atractosteus spatula]|nr:PKHJ1 protein [Atractosteus spatula]